MSLEHADPAAAEARPAVTADAVLDAALTLFAERGYHGTAVSQIAASLGLRTAWWPDWRNPMTGGSPSLAMTSRRFHRPGAT